MQFKGVMHNISRMSGWVKNRGEKSRWIQHEAKGLSDAATMREGERG